jgi:hypothetical protein
LQIESYFRTGNPIVIDGVSVAAQVQRCDFYGLDLRDFAMQAERRPVPLSTARVGIILVYPTSQQPSRVDLTWNRFNSFIWTVNTVVYAFDEVLQTKLTRVGGNDSFHWEGGDIPQAPPPQGVLATSELAASSGFPWLWPLCGLTGLVCLVAGLRRRAVGGSRPVRFYLTAAAAFWLAAAVTSPYAQGFAQLFHSPRVVDSARADEVFALLHGNLYRAFDYRDEDQIYDTLAVSTTGDFLTDVYLAVRQGLVMAEQGGAVARVKEVTIVEGEVVEQETDEARDGRGFAYRCRWNVAGTVEHWGHIHERTNQYEALFHVNEQSGMWKVSGLELIDELRLRFDTRLRGL